jgi:hypothetical protein
LVVAPIPPSGECFRTVAQSTPSVADPVAVSARTLIYDCGHGREDDGEVRLRSQALPSALFPGSMSV